MHPSADSQGVRGPPGTNGRQFPPCVWALHAGKQGRDPGGRRRQFAVRSVPVRPQVGGRTQPPQGSARNSDGAGWGRESLPLDRRSTHVQNTARCAQPFVPWPQRTVLPSVCLNPFSHQILRDRGPAFRSYLVQYPQRLQFWTLSSANYEVLPTVLAVKRAVLNFFPSGASPHAPQSRTAKQQQ